MGRCERCGNDYDKTFEMILAGERHVFDSFECAINAVAPVCASCGNRILGHGIETGEKFYCCAHCSDLAGVPGIKDRAP